MKTDQRPLDVTVIVPTYNRAHYLGECLSSLLGQSQPPGQVIVVDDGSTDDTAAVVASFSGRVAYIRQSNAGKASALNNGLKHATGAAVWIFDDDDVADPQALSRLSAALDGAPEAGFSFGNFDNFRIEDDGQRTVMPVPPASFDPDDLTCAIIERCFVFQPAMLARRRLYDAVGPFDTDFVRAQDYEMLTRLSLEAPGVHVPAVVFHQRQHVERRGTAALGIDGRDVWERQKTFDAKVLDKVYRTFPLDAYLPRSDRAAIDTAAGKVRALLRRAAGMARKKLWQVASDDIAAAAELAQADGIVALEEAEAAILRRVFDEFGHGRDDLHAGNPLLRRVGASPAGPFQASLLAALTWPIFRYTLQAARRGDRAEVMRLGGLYRAVGGWGLLPQHLRLLASKVMDRK